MSNYYPPRTLNTPSEVRDTLQRLFDQKLDIYFPKKGLRGKDQPSARNRAMMMTSQIILQALSLYNTLYEKRDKSKTKKK